jgi:hypothetical protein
MDLLLGYCSRSYLERYWFTATQIGHSRLFSLWWGQCLLTDLRASCGSHILESSLCIEFALPKEYSRRRLARRWSGQSTRVVRSLVTVDIRITKRGSRNLLSCTRPDGTLASADIGPTLPHHDLAHFVVERAFDLQDGFFGNIARGYTPVQLSDKNIIQSLGVSPYRAEILARALGSLHTGACSPEQFEDLVNAELTSLGLPSMGIKPATRDALLAEFNGHLTTFLGLRDGDSMSLFFSALAPGVRPLS